MRRARNEEISDCGIVEMMVIAYQLGEAKRFGINEDDVTAPRVTYDDWGDPIHNTSRFVCTTRHKNFLTGVGQITTQPSKTTSGGKTFAISIVAPCKVLLL